MCKCSGGSFVGIAVALATAGAIIAGAGVGAAERGSRGFGWTWPDDGVKELRELHIAHKAESPLQVETANGSISVVKGGSDTVDVRATVRSRDQERLAKIKVTAVRGDDGVLLVKAQFPDNKAREKDSVSLEIIIPDARGLTLKSSNGGITADGFGGKAVIDTSNGAITLSNHAGDAELTSSNGAINGTNIAAGVKAETSNGAIKLHDVNSPVSVETSNGGADVELSQKAIGPVTIKTSNGRANLTVGASFAGTLVVDTSNGLVNVDSGSRAWKLNMKGKSHASIDTGVSGGKSVVETSNGSVTIRAKSDTGATE